MALDREAIFAALFARLQTVPGVVTFSRRLRDWNDVPPEEQPALFLTTMDETQQNEQGRPPKHLLRAKAWVYCRSSDTSVPPSTKLNQIVSAIETALERQSNEATALFSGGLGWSTTLGGLVLHAWITGPVVTDEGTFGDQAVAVVPIEMLAVTPPK